MTAALAAVALLVLVAAPLVVRARRRRRFLAPDLELARQRLGELQAMPAPDELFRAPDLTKATARKHRKRTHPVPRKRGGRQWGQ